MKRKRAMFLLITNTAVCLMLSSLWLRSYWKSDELSYGEPTSIWDPGTAIESANGRVELRSWRWNTDGAWRGRMFRYERGADFPFDFLRKMVQSFDFNPPNFLG